MLLSGEHLQVKRVLSHVTELTENVLCKDLSFAILDKAQFLCNQFLKV